MVAVSLLVSTSAVDCLKDSSLKWRFILFIRHSFLFWLRRVCHV